jgi:hypothetical protein
MPPIVELDDALGRLGITPGADSAVDAKVSGLLDAISAEVRRLTRRAFEGTPTVYDEVLRVADAATVILPHAPVTEVLAVREIHFDGTEEGILEPRIITDGVATALADAAAVGATTLKVDSVADVLVGTRLQVGSGDTLEVVRVSAVGTAGIGGTGLTVAPALRYPQANNSEVLEVHGSTLWLLELPRRGRLRLNRRVEYARITYLVSGEIPADITLAVYDWLEDGWAEVQEPDTDPATRALSSQSHDSWSESYEDSNPATESGTAAFAVVSRRPPTRVSRALLGYWHPSGPVEPAT